MSDSIQDTEEWIVKEETKRLAKLCLEEKWYDIANDDEDEWGSPCAFCKNAIGRTPEYENYCKNCYIGDTQICENIDLWYRKGDKSVIIKALEELAKTGELSVKIRLEVIVV